jgi:hypothetical protein
VSPSLLPRFVSLDFAAQTTRATALEPREALRRAALVLALAPAGDVPAEALVADWRASVRALEARGGFSSPFRSSSRYVAAALGFVADVRRIEFVEAVAETVRRLAEVGAQGARGRRLVDAALLVMEGALTRTGIVPTFERVRRLVEGAGVPVARPAVSRASGPTAPEAEALAALACLAPPPSRAFAEELTGVLLSADAVERSALAAGVATAG